jgi:5-methylcytosine-specific restriction enzyme A
MKLKGITYPKLKLKKGRWNYDPFCHTKEWKQDRLMHLNANPLCVMCKAEGKIVEATVSDHIIPRSQGGDPWDWKNRQGLCKRCDAIKTACDNPNNQ